MVQTNNELYKDIAEAYGITIESGVHTNNYYLHKIAEHVCQKTYSEIECNGKYLKDIAEELAETTYSGHHFNNFWLKEICTALTGQDYNNHFDNYYLEIWAINALNREESKLVWLVPPSNMEYGDFNASGVLTDKNDSSVKISGATVNLVIGSTVVDTAVTDSNGVVTFEGSPVHTGTHSFKLVFNGNHTYDSTESSVVTITVSKETTYLNVEEYDSTGFSDGTVNIFGQLLDNDSPQHSVTGETVKIIDKSDDTVLGTAITDNQGYFDCDLELSASNYSIRVIYEGTDDYNSSYEDINIEVIDPYLEVIVDKPVLSYADNDFTALSAVVHSASVGNIRVDFSISDAQFTTYGITNNHGVCTALDSYQSLGLGDIELVATATVNGILLTKTYELQDIWRYNNLTSNDGLFSCQVKGTGASTDKCNASYSSNGLTMDSISTTDVIYVLNSVPSGDYSIEFEIVSISADNINGYTGALACNGVQYLMNTVSGQQVRRFDESAQSWVTPKVQTGDLIRFNVESGTVKVYHNDTLKGSKSSYNTQTGLYSPVTGRTITVKNMKIRTL